MDDGRRWKIGRNNYSVTLCTRNVYFINRNELAFAAIKRNPVTNGIDLIKWDSVLSKFMTFMHTETPFDRIETDDKLMDKIINAAAER